MSAAVVNITVTQTGGPAFVTAWPTGQPLPTASYLNVNRAGETAPNLATVATGANGHMSILANTTTHIVVDLLGWYEPTPSSTGGRLVALTPDRLLDTREIGPRLGAGTTTELTVVGGHGVPAAGVSAVALNVTGTDVAQAGYVTVWGDGGRPLASNLNLDTGGTRANQVIVPVGADGKIRLFNSRAMHLVVDIAGWYTDDTAKPDTHGLFVPITPVRLADSRAAPGVPGGGCVAELRLPAGASAAVTNITLTENSVTGFATAYPAGAAQPWASTLNVDSGGQTRPNHAIVAAGSAGAFDVYLKPRTQLVVDLDGYFT